MKDLIAARIETGRPIHFEVDDVSVHELDVGAPARPLPARGRAGRAELRRRRRLRRLPRHLPRQHPRRDPHRLLARVPVRLARHPRAGAAVERGADLCLARPRLLAPQHALAGDHAALPPVRAGRGPRRVAGRSDLAGAPRAARARRLDAQRGPDPREGRHRDAQLRRRADAVRPALPRRRRRAHRAADRGEGAEPRGRGRSRPRRRARDVVPERRRVRARELLARRAADASGAPSTSRGG